MSVHLPVTAFRGGSYCYDFVYNINCLCFSGPGSWVSRRWFKLQTEVIKTWEKATQETRKTQQT